MTQTTDNLIEAAEARATCKMGMAAQRPSFVVHLADVDARRLGVESKLHLRIEDRRGTYDLLYVSCDGINRAISHEPSEPEAQALGIAYARRNPIGAALELLGIDRDERIRSAAAAEMNAPDDQDYWTERLDA